MNVLKVEKLQEDPTLLQLDTMKKLSPKINIKRLAIFVVLFSGIFTLFHIYLGSNWWHLLFDHKNTKNRFVSNASEIKGLLKLAGIAIRHENDEWVYANDICQTGVVFPSTVMTSTLQNVSMYFHDEKELQNTVDYMKHNSSWGRRNLNSLMKPLEKLKEAYFIDIYAGLGLFSLPIAKMGLLVIAVEYRYSFAERLCRGITAGQFKGKIFIVNNLVSHSVETVSLDTKHISQRYKTGVDVSKDTFTRVSTIKLNSLLDRFPVKEAVIKIDMATGNTRGLLNSEEFFEKVKVHYILMEWSNVCRSPDGARLVEFLMKYQLVPCLTPKCTVIFKTSLYASWPAYIVWVNRALLPDDSKMRSNSTRVSKLTPVDGVPSSNIASLV